MYRDSLVPSPFVLTAVDGTVTAHLRTTGAPVWGFRVPDGQIDYRMVTRIIVEAERVVIVAARMDERGLFAGADSTAHVCCLDHATGGLLWHHRVKVGLNIAQFTATLLVDQGTVFLAHGGVLSAFALETGALLWQQQIHGTSAQTQHVPIALAVPGRAVQGDAR